MTDATDVYRELQEHLDKMPIGYPATQSGVEINLLKTIFTPDEAKVTTHLDYKHKTVDQIFETAKVEVGSKGELTRILDAIVAKGGITRRVRDNQKQYAVLPLVLWGMYEHQLKRLTPDFLMNFGCIDGIPVIVERPAKVPNAPSTAGCTSLWVPDIASWRSGGCFVFVDEALASG